MKIAAVAVLVLLASAPAAPSDARPSALVLRAGVALEGPQHTVESAPLLGTAVEWAVPFGTLGLGGEWAHESPSPVVSSVDVWHLGVYVRERLGAVPGGPCLAAGAGVSQLRLNWTTFAGTSSKRSAAGPAGWLGVEMPIRVAPRAELRIEARYLAFLSDSGSDFGSGANAEDYFTLAAALAFAP